MARLSAVAFMVALGWGTAQAQFLPDVGKDGFPGEIPNLSSASASNTAGVLDYCVNNNYLKGDSAQSLL